MNIPPRRLLHFLGQQQAQYDWCTHRHSNCTVETARSAHVPAHQLAKAVIVEDDDGRCLMAVVPGDHHVRMNELSRLLDRGHLHLAAEPRIAELFPDCDRGAIPALGMAWDVETVVDDELDAAGDRLYVECGDHERLLRMSREQFRALTAGLRHGCFSNAGRAESHSTRSR
jgi:Ala-tRNA(Pro) deacylase